MSPMMMINQHHLHSNSIIKRIRSRIASCRLRYEALFCSGRPRRQSVRRKPVGHRLKIRFSWTIFETRLWRVSFFVRPNPSCDAISVPSEQPGSRRDQSVSLSIRERPCQLRLQAEFQCLDMIYERRKADMIATHFTRSR